MKNKKCNKCKLTKSLKEFYIRKTGNRAGEYYEKCMVCMKARGREYYHKNHTRQLALALTRRRKAYKIKREFINNFKDRPCADCRIKYPYYVMDLDHKKGSNKVNDVGFMTSRNWSLKKIIKEAKKCEVVCANCHRIRTFKRYAEVAKVVTAGL